MFIYSFEIVYYNQNAITHLNKNVDNSTVKNRTINKITSQQRVSKLLWSALCRDFFIVFNCRYEKNSANGIFDTTLIFSTESLGP